jgi:hypothetical protein
VGKFIPLVVCPKRVVVVTASDGGGGPPRGPTGEAATLHELLEALTAVGNYLEAANHLLGAELSPNQKTLSEVVEKSLAQTERASATARQLRDLLHRPSSITDDGH